jgi:alpha-L-fucosidase 2
VTSNELWYDDAASVWTEALPIGNGRLGAMIFGGVWDERIQVNESTFYNGGPYQPINPDARQAMERVRQLILDGQFMEAERAAYAGAMASPDRQVSYQPIGDVRLSFHHDLTTRGYRRSLDLSTGITTTAYECDGVQFRRDIFVSAVRDVIVCRISVDRKAAISMHALLSSPQNGAPEVRNDTTLGYLGRNRSQNGIEGALDFAFRSRVIAEGGFLDIGPEVIRVREADGVTLLIDAATSFKRYDDVSGDPQALTQQRLDAAAAIPFDTLVAEHIAEHQRLFGSMEIALDGPDRSHIPTDQRVRDYVGTDDPGLAALYVQLGRYLAISSSRPGTQPSNLQGIWNEDIVPAWNSKFTVNINTEMNYWLADPANLRETFLPLIELVEDVAETGQAMAKAHYGASGWVLHHNTDLWRATGPIDGPKWGLWPTGGAWLCVQLFDHYRFHQDIELLRRIYPLMKGAAEFMLDTLVVLPGSDRLVTCPSVSPENRHPFGTSLCAGPAMDSQILRDLFADVAEASETLGIDPDFRDAVNAARARLPQDRIGKGGQLQEWIEDWDLEAPEQHHRHVSHLYGLYPSLQIDPIETPDLARAAAVSLDTRGDDATGWGIGWRINLWARLGDGERASHVLDLLLSPQRTYPNLFDAHPPFQIDGNFGGAAGILEMLIQSRPGEIRLLPALPKAWGSGRLKGVLVRGGLRVDLEWKQGAVTALNVYAKSPGSVTIRHGGEITQLKYQLDLPATLTFR